METDSTPTPKELEGIKAIQFLQLQVGIEESNEDALRGWRKMSKSDRKFTLLVYSSGSK